MSKSDSTIETVLLLGGAGFLGYKYLLPMIRGGGGAGAVTPPVAAVGQDAVAVPKAGAPTVAANTKVPLGIRNNNPGNIRWNILNLWTGQIGQESGYAKFSAPQYGYRAMFKLLVKYINSYKLNTIAKIATRWAPANENNTQAWARNVSSFSGIGVNTVINAADAPTMLKLARGITGAENGAAFVNNWGDGAIMAGWGIAG